MKELDRVLERLRAMPEEKQAEAALLLEDFLDEQEHGSLVTDEQWEEVTRRLAAPDELIDHEEVEAHMRDKYGI
jgi:hypothetical protein